MRITQLEYFTKTIECGSITRAAKELYVSQPALTKAISGLEAEFSIRLIEREARGVRITAEGQEFYLYAKEIIAARNNLQKAFGPKPNGGVDRLRIASQQLDFLYEELDRVYDKSDAPVCVDLVEGDRSFVLESVLDRKANIGLMILSDEDSMSFKREMQNTDIEIHTLDLSTTYVHLCPASPLYHKEHITTADAVTQFHAVLDMEPVTKTGMITYNVQYHVNPERMLFCNSVRACCHFMESRGAILYAPKWVSGIVRPEGVRVTPLLMEDGSPYATSTHLVWIRRGSELLSRAEDRFIQQLEDRFAE